MPEKSYSLPPFREPFDALVATSDGRLKRVVGPVNLTLLGIGIEESARVKAERGSADIWRSGDFAIWRLNLAMW